MNALVSQESNAAQDVKRKNQALKSQKLSYMLGIDEQEGGSTPPSRRQSRKKTEINGSDDSVREADAEFKKLMGKQSSLGSLPHLNTEVMPLVNLLLPRSFCINKAM